ALSRNRLNHRQPGAAPRQYHGQLAIAQMLVPTRRYAAQHFQELTVDSLSEGCDAFTCQKLIQLHRAGGVVFQQIRHAALTEQLLLESPNVQGKSSVQPPEVRIGGRYS